MLFGAHLGVVNRARVANQKTQGAVDHRSGRALPPVAIEDLLLQLCGLADPEQLVDPDALQANSFECSNLGTQ